MDESSQCSGGEMSGTRKVNRPWITSVFPSDVCSALLRKVLVAFIHKSN